MSKYFGTDGFRGEANVDLTADHAFSIGKIVGTLLNEQKKKNNKENEPCRVVIGKDTRRSGYMLEYALAAGLSAVGTEACLLHVTTTPSVAYLVRADRFDCGIMISASHNPYYDNGIKLISSEGEKMSESITDEIEAFLDGKRPEPVLAKGEKIGAISDYAGGRNRYIGYLISLVTHSFKRLRIGLDCANGSAWNIARHVFEALGAKTYTIHNEPNGLNINEKCGSTHIDDLIRLVKEENLDMGFAYDGDADRCLAVDEKGQLVSGDKILYLSAKAMAARGELAGNTVVTTVMSNLGLYKALEAEGIRYVATAVGDRFVYEAMQQNGWRLGGEDSGHIIYGKYATTGDGILTSLRIVEEVLEAGVTLSQLTEGMTVYPQLLKNKRVTDKEKVLSAPVLQEAIDHAAQTLGDRGRVLVRASGTEPVIRVMVEAETEALCEEQVSALLSAVETAEG